MEWKPFIELFKRAVIDNTRLAKSRKLQHLKSILIGDAHKQLHSITITNDSFDIVIDILENRYDNNHLILRRRSDKNFKQRSLTAEISKDFWNLMETTEEHRLA